MDKGYVKLWRKTLDAGWLKNHKLFVFWSYCLMKATHRERDVLIGNQKIHLFPGQFIFGRKSAADDCNMTERQIRTSVRFLEKHENLTIKTTNKFSIISIVNWDIYQQDNYKNDQQFDQQSANKVPTNVQQSATNKNVKNVKNERIKEYSPDFEKFWQSYPSKVGKEAAWKSWAKNGRPDITVILESIEKQKSSRRWMAGFIPNPSTWINQKRWLDEEPEEVKSRWF